MIQRWVVLGFFGLALAQTENVVVSPDGQLEPLAFGTQTCLRVMQEGRLLGDPVCVDVAAESAGSLTLRLSQGVLEVPYRANPALGRVSYLIRLGSGWPVTQAAPAPIPAVPPTSLTPPEAGPSQPPATPAPPEATPVDQPPSSPPQGKLPPPVDPPEQNLRDNRLDAARQAGGPIVHIFLRQDEQGVQVAYSIVARNEVATPASAMRLYLDGKPVPGTLTRRTTGREHGRLQAGQAEYGWIDLGPLTGERLRLEWSLAGQVIAHEWRLR